jgi:N-carbamoylputrescine amidase
MKLAMYQMSMSSDRKENLSKAVSAINAQKNNDLILFPEVMLTPFFPQYRKEDLLEALGLTTDDILTTPEDDFLHVLRDSAAAAGIYVSPNVYAEQGDGCFDTSFLIDRWGKVIGDTEMATSSPLNIFMKRTTTLLPHTAMSI